MRVISLLAVVCFSVVLVQGLPTAWDDLTVLSDGRDTAIVESTVREVRAAVPDKLQDLVDHDTVQAFLHTYKDSDGDDNERGYHKRSEDEGGKGYKHFDSYHKKDGDKYGFETHSAYGKADGKESDAGGHSGKYKEDDEGSDGDKENYEAEEGDDEGKEEETKSAYKVIEEVDEDGDAEQYQEGEDGGKSAAYGSYHAEDDDKEDNGHYTEEESDDNAEYGGIGSKGNAAHYTDGSSGYTYGSEEEGAEEGDKGDADAKSEHYEAAAAEEEDDEGDY